MADYSPKTETVYGGPIAMHQTVLPGTWPAAPGKETLFDAQKFSAKRPDSSLARAAASKQVKMASIRFFIVAGVTLLETFAYMSRGQQTLAMSSAFVCAVFGLIGFFIFRLSKAALLCGIAIYGLNTAMMLFGAMQVEGGVMFLLWPLVVHGIILYRLYRTYGLLSDLHALDV